MRSFVVAAACIAAIIFGARPALDALQRSPHASPCANALPVPSALRLPRSVPSGEPVAIEQSLLGYLSSYRYRDLGWCVDKSLRDTGPYIHHIAFGTHPTVRIYYSPEMMQWLRGGRREVWRPAVAYAGQSDAQLRPTDWTIMIRRSSASHDGWF